MKYEYTGKTIIKVCSVCKVKTTLKELVEKKGTFSKIIRNTTAFATVGVSLLAEGKKKKLYECNSCRAVIDLESDLQKAKSAASRINNPAIETETNNDFQKPEKGILIQDYDNDKVMKYLEKSSLLKNENFLNTDEFERIKKNLLGLIK